MIQEKVFVIRRVINWRYLFTRAAIGGLFLLAGVTLFAEGWLLASIVSQLVGGAL